MELAKVKFVIPSTVSQFFAKKIKETENDRKEGLEANASSEKTNPKNEEKQ